MTEILNSVLPDLVYMLVGTIALIVAAMLTMALLQFRAYLKSQLSEGQFLVIDTLVTAGIRAAEQMGLKGVIENEGQAKLSAAVNFISKSLAQRGILISDEELRMTIESQISEGVHKGFATLENTFAEYLELKD